MDAEVVEHMTTLYLTEIQSHLEHSAGVGRAADARASGIQPAEHRALHELADEPRSATLSFSFHLSTIRAPTFSWSCSRYASKTFGVT
jgi:hypothetical protein